MIETIAPIPVPRLAIVTATCLLFAMKMEAQSLDYTEEAAKESLAFMDRSGGAWVTSNAAYWTADSGEPTEYVMAFGLEADGYVLRGCMWGQNGDEVTPVFWTFYSAWDPVAGAILAYQVGPSGAVAVGHERPLANGGTESIQTLAFPGTEPSRVRHRNRRVHADTLHTQSYDEVEGQLTARRTYTWTWSTDVNELPCRGGPTANARDDDDPLAFLDPLIGTWVSAPEWLADNPGAERLIPIAFEWGSSRRSITHQSGLPTANGRLFTLGTIIWNPTSRRAQFTSSQGNDDLFFEGFYESVDSSTVRRTYTVHYPDQAPVRFRETFYLAEPDVIDWFTEWEQFGEWTPRRGTGDPEYRAIRASAVPSDALEGFDRLIGTWYIDTSRTSRTIDSQSELDIGGIALSAGWGIGRRWMTLAEYAEQNGTKKVSGSGIIGFDPHVRAVTFVLHTDEGITLRGTLEAVNELTIERRYRSYSPAGTTRSWVDTWRWETVGADCFEWTTREVMTISEPESWSPYWVCREPA